MVGPTLPSARFLDAVVLRSLVLPAVAVLLVACSDSTPPRDVNKADASDKGEAMVGPAGGTVVTPSGAAGVQIPAGVLSQQVLVTVTRLSASSTPGAGPLPTTLKQYPPYYEFATSPAMPQLGDSVRVGVCQVTDPASPLYAPEASHSRLRLAHTVGSTIEILERVGVDDFLRCTNVTASASAAGRQGWRGAVASVLGKIVGATSVRPLYAAHGGLGGKVRSFSPFAAVDQAVNTVSVTLATPTVTVGSSVQATAVLKDADGNKLAGRLVTWTSSNVAVATVSASGLVTGVSAGGPVTITATSEGQSGAAAVTVMSAPLNLTIITGGGAYTCGLTSAGAAYCWGRNSFGQLGDGTTTSRLTPRLVAGGLTFTSLAASGDSHTCGLTNGAAYCWGNNNNGQLGDGTTTNRLTPTPVADGLAFTSLVAGGFHTCGLTSGGAAYCWGYGSFGQLGNGTTTNRLTPTVVTGGLTFSSLAAAGDWHTCGLTSGGAAYCWGFNADGELGDGSTATSRLTPTLVVGGLTFTRLVAGSFHTCGSTSGAVDCWGDNTYGQLGDGTTTRRLTPTLVAGGLTLTSLAIGGGGHSCGLTNVGAAYCWGRNFAGQIGDGTTTNRLTPAPVAGGLTFTNLTRGGGGHTCGLTGEGAAYCWGDNSAGQLGDGTTTIRLTPTLVARP